VRLLRDLSHLPDACRGAALAIGNFDGMHLGHRAVLGVMLDAAGRRGIPSAVMTFEPHPRRFFNPAQSPHRIEPLQMRLRRLRALGVEYIVLLRFDAALARCSAQRFIEEFLVRRLAVAQVVTGEEFCFGHERSGNAALLHDASGEYGFRYTAVPPMMAGGGVCSSSRVRAHLAAGEMPKAAALLGRPYEMAGLVTHGAGRGRELGAPTANLRPPPRLFLPRFGVYAVQYRDSEGQLPEEGRDWKPGVANFGVRPSFGEGNAPLLEVHGLKEGRQLYGVRLRVRFAAFLREERKFESAEALRAQIAGDIKAAREALEA
jgi:riboflavin kinase/FMN adenylyltransferase